MQKVTKRNIALAIIFLLILVVVALLIGNFTFSYLGADVSDDVTTQGETTASGDTIIFSKDNDLSLQATTDNFNATSGNLTDTVNPSARLIASSKTNEATATYYAGVRINNNTFTYSSGTTADVILTVRDETGAIVTTSDDSNLTYVTVTDKSGAQISGFDITGKTGAFNIAIKHPISTTSSTTGTTHTWTFTLTFVNYTYDQSVNENATLDMEVILQKDEIMPPTLAEICTSGKNFAGCIVEYNNMVGDGADGLYYHDGVGTYTNANQEAGDNSYRFAGANPNNYVCFGSDAASCPADNLYRIIGVFGNQVKLIKHDYATTSLLGTNGAFSRSATSPGSYYKGSQSTLDLYNWNNSTNNNTWSESNLNTVNLNTNYLNNIGNKWSSLIATTSWKVGGNTYQNIYNVPVKQTYTNEIVNPAESTTYSAKIGLMYVSDYGYATSPSNWNTNLGSYNSTTVRDNNWMWMGLFEWTISRRSDDTNRAFLLDDDGLVGYAPVSGRDGVRPSFYLESSVVLSGGSGSAAAPYRIA